MEQITLQGNDNPERNAIVSNMLEKLTAEAKFVLYAIFNTPGELSELLFGGVVKKRTVLHFARSQNIDVRDAAQYLNRLTRKEKPNKQLVRHYLKALGWSTKDINKTIFAIREFSRELAEL
jgi:hypothetical protein